MLVKAYAKINLYLRVLGRRPDGYHNITTIYQTVDLADRLEFTFTSPDDSSLHSPLLSLSPDSSFDVPTDESNLIIIAVKFLEKYADTKCKGLKIMLSKQIPIGAGLGGGSADAAATLVAVNRLCSLGLTQEELSNIALSVGADVPFFLQGGTALGEGRGERLSPLQNNLQYYVVIVFPGFSISTRMAYNSLEGLSSDVKEAVCEMQQIVRVLGEGDVNQLCELIANDFSPVLEKRYPELTNVRGSLLSAGCSSAMLSGSGSAVFGICESKEKAEIVRAIMEKKYPYVYICEPTLKGIEITG
ncbi:4-(cytidine 5'-diphospho)-2-C-methyl-D-erythritol kinase [Candidatus Sumerlaeota bacterium]|nr:4-(cytidine 5'-diphospho)-2-C-methyl-D-erythritol kinase [Candidatus Sumerlaeota bacterium]